MNYFVIKLPLKTDNIHKKLQSKYEVARIFYNSVLAECKKRKGNYLYCEEYRKAIELLKDNKKAEADEHFKQARVNSGFYLRSAKKHGLDNSIEQYGCQHVRKNSWIEEHLDANTCLDLCNRAFEAVKTHKKTYFKRYGKDYITSLGKDNKIILLKDNTIIWPSSRGIPALEIDLNIDKNDVKHAFVLNNPDKVKYIKVTRTFVGNKWQYYADVTCEGNPPLKPNQVLGIGKVGIDVGPSKLSYRTDCYRKGVINFASKLDFKQKQIRRLQRKLDRQRRANNPDNYDEKGRCKKDVKWVVGKREAKTLEQLREIKRKEKAFRRCLHGRAANLLRSMGNKLLLEKLEYNKWQQNKRLSKSVTKRAPGLLVQLLRNKFFGTDGTVHDINTYKTKLSQTCPFCRKVKKKPPYYLKSARVHDCDCGFKGDRDDVAALLALCVTDADEINFDEAKMYSLREIPTLAGRVDGGKQTAN